MDDGCRFFSNHLSKSKDEAFTTTLDNDSARNLSLESALGSISANQKARNNKRAVSSFTESALMVDILKTEGYDVIEAAGAGYKILAVIQGKLVCNKFIIFRLTYKLILSPLQSRNNTSALSLS